MSDLLSGVLESHGGLERWERVTRLRVRLSLDGPFWGGKGWPQVYRDRTVVLDAHREHISFSPFPAAGLRSEFEACDDDEVLRITAEDGTILQQQHFPRAWFPRYSTGLAWDAMQVAYFASCATWSYLTAPFVFTYPGVQCREIAPWGEDGQVWRRLEVIFPRSLPNHNSWQVFYYDEQMLQRRIDYEPDVTGSPIAHYTHDVAFFDGLGFYTRGRVHPRAPDGTANRAITPITIDIDSVSVESV